MFARAYQLPVDGRLVWLVNHSISAFVPYICTISIAIQKGSVLTPAMMSGIAEGYTTELTVTFELR